MEEEFKTEEDVQKWLAEDRYVPGLVASAVASTLFEGGYVYPSSLLNIQREDLGSLNISPPHRNILFNKLQQQQQQQQQIPSDAMAGVIAFGNDYIAKKRTIVLSDATVSAGKEILDMLDLPEEGASWPNKPANSGAFPEFEWLTSSEDSTENRAKYMAHLENNLQLPANYLMGDVQPMRALLSVELTGSWGSRKISGTTDVVIAKAKDIRNKAIRNCVEALLELNKPKNLQAKDHNPQTICEHLAASYLNRTRAVVSALTDLNRSWTFYWFAHKEEGTGVALHKIELQGEGAAGLSKYILESLNDESRRETLPTTFVDRLSFEAVMDTIREDHRRKRARSNFGGGGGNSSGSQARNGKPPAGGNQHPPSGPGGNSSSGMESPNNNNGAGDRNQTSDMASVLRLFAPHSNCDVANELDLLDMVDEADQYEIIRSFAAKHIVPYMTGQNL